MRNIINLVNVKISTETYGSFASNLDADTYFIQYDYPMEMFQLIKVDGVVFIIVGITVNDIIGTLEYKVKLYYGSY